MTDPNHDIVPTLRMFDGVMTGLAADEIERLRKRVAELEAARDALRYRTLINMLDRNEAVVVIAGVSNVGSAMLDAMLDRFMEPKR
ncbi:hypothetical protein LGM80_23480 [Burkholderia multivorans]|uniref:hypothetical protein n=1 Tax=Burkholderia multivorans TaxID=87883 RepID=UPI001C22B6F5|nr:hypothetical protein [Burkholderia multivorans]MBU9310901.1 hypothetical protein [Burkholderia multivorans]MBU9318920.1 hypothetical protein [Burkholderia multivorans]MBU9604454.1 hypothetical protein [Burkholderia multivorans]MCA8376327.1 hypothetical protein [Burkholderia multivorans]MDN7951806.1 hypothetical protein [Burkholderia multivorans]